MAAYLYMHNTMFWKENHKESFWRWLQSQFRWNWRWISVEIRLTLILGMIDGK